MIQGSPEWHAGRRCRLRSSDLDKLLTAVKAEPSKQADDFIDELLAEAVFLGPNYFSGNPNNKPPNPAMLEGVRREPEARRWLCHDLDCEIQQVGMIVHDDSDCIGFNLWSASTDGLIVDKFGELAAVVELKCPLLATQAKYVRKPEALLMQYRQQVAGELIVSGLPLCYLCSYAPPLPPVRLEVRPDAYMERMHEVMAEFTQRYDEAMHKVLGYGIGQMLARLHPDDLYLQASS